MKITLTKETLLYLARRQMNLPEEVGIVIQEDVPQRKGERILCGVPISCLSTRDICEILALNNKGNILGYMNEIAKVFGLSQNTAAMVALITSQPGRDLPEYAKKEFLATTGRQELPQYSYYVEFLLNEVKK